MCVEERDAHQKEKAQLEYDVAKYETRTLQVLERLETEAQKVSLDYEDKYKSLGKDGKKVSGGCHGDGDKDFVDRFVDRYFKSHECVICGECDWSIQCCV